MYSMRTNSGYQYPQTTTSTYQNNFQSSYNDRSSTNPISFNAHRPLPYGGSKTIELFPSTPTTRRVNPALINNPNQPSRSTTTTTYGKSVYYSKGKDTRAEIDDSPIIDPSAFQYLNLNDRKSKKKMDKNDIESGIDSRPIINLDAVAQLERRRQQQLEKNNRLRGDDGSKAGIDDRSIVDANAFRYIEAKKSQKQGQQFDSGIDDRPITNPDAFKYIDGRRQTKPIRPSNNEPSIDTRPIIDPDAFKYIEKRDIPVKRNIESGIDSEPIVNPNAFRYLEPTIPSSSSSRYKNNEPGVDTRSIINPNAFQYIEKRTTVKRQPAESSIDTRPIVDPEAFKYIERKETKRQIDYGPDIDERSYVNPQAFRYIDRQVGKRYDVPTPEIDTRSLILGRNPNAFAHIERKLMNKRNYVDDSGIDERSYVNPDAFKYLEGQSSNSRSRSSNMVPTIDTRSYVDTDAFQHLESREQRRNYKDYDGIDDRPFIPPIAFRHLEFTDLSAYPYAMDYSSSYGQSDV